MCAAKREPVTIMPGFQATCRLLALPASKLTLESLSISKIEQARTAVPKSGTAENVPDGTPYAIRWIVTCDGRTRRVLIGEPPPFEVQGGRFSLDLRVDVFELELFGEGTLGIEMQSRFPRCAPVKLEGKISFDNSLSVSLEGDGAPRIGSVRALKIETGGVFAECLVRLEVFEADVAQDEQASTEDFSRHFTWSAADRAPRAWRIGCHQADGLVAFDYGEDAEVGDYEFGYVASVKLAEEEAGWHQVRVRHDLVSVPRPALRSIELVEEVDDDLRISWQKLNPAFWGERSIRPAAYRLRGSFAGFEPGLPVRLAVVLWVRKEPGAGLEPFVPTSDKLKVFTVGDDGSFDVEVTSFANFTLSYKTYHDDLTDQSAGWEFWGWVLCVSGGKVPFQWLIDCPKGSGVRSMKRGMLCSNSDVWDAGILTRCKGRAGAEEAEGLQKGNSGDAVEELQIRLAGFGGVMPSGEFDDATEAAVKLFQEDYMDVEPSGVVDTATMEAIAAFGEKYTVFDKGQLECYSKTGACACGGFGRGINKGVYKSTTHTESQHKYEYPGLHRFVLWALKGVMFRMESASNPSLRLGAFSCAYRCSLNNKWKGRTTTNHMGKAIDLLIYTKNTHGQWSRPSDTPGRKKLSDAVRDLFCEHAKAQVRWGEKNRISLEPGTKAYASEYVSPTWVHADARQFDATYLDDRFFCKDEDSLNGEPLSEYEYS